MFIDWNDPIFFCDVPRDGGDDLVADFELAQIDDFGAEMGSLGLGDIGWANDFVSQHQIDHTDARGLGLCAEGCRLVRADEAQVHQDIYQIIVSFCHGSVFATQIRHGNVITEY